MRGRQGSYSAVLPLKGLPLALTELSPLAEAPGPVGGLLAHRVPLATGPVQKLPASGSFQSLTQTLVCLGRHGTPQKQKENACTMIRLARTGGPSRSRGSSPQLPAISANEATVGLDCAEPAPATCQEQARQAEETWVIRAAGRYLGIRSMVNLPGPALWGLRSSLAISSNLAANVIMCSSARSP